MNIVIMGLPGAGKGTQAENIVEKYQTRHISTGNMMRQAITDGSELGKELKKYLDKGELVPDELTAKILKAEIDKPIYESGFLLDGYPRNVSQVETLTQILKELKREIDVILYLEIDEEEVIERLANRVVCSNGHSYNLLTNPPKSEKVCDICGEKLSRRDDDTPENIKNRLEIAKEQTLPVVEYYETNLPMKVVKIQSANKSIDQVKNEIFRELDKYND